MEKKRTPQDAEGQKNLGGACETLDPGPGFLPQNDGRRVNGLQADAVPGQAAGPGRRPPGGRTTISPPPNVLRSSQPLASGLDKLVIALDVKWNPSSSPTERPVMNGS